MNICKLCVLPENPPQITLNSDGVCSLCSDPGLKNSLEAGKNLMLETELVRILNKNKGSGRYDCLVMCSGGKDSTSSLYYVKKKYKLNPLAFTFDHGFETEDALNNVKNAVEKLGVEWILFRTDYIKDLFAEMLKSKTRAVICHLCSIWYMQLTFEMAANFRIPIIIAGWTKGQSNLGSIMTKCACDISAPEFKEMAESTKDFLVNRLKMIPKYKDFPSSMEEVLKKAEKRQKTLVLSPHWFIRKSPEEYTKTIEEELGWKYPALSYPGKSTNCLMNFVSSYLSYKHYGYTHYHVEMSKLIRMNLMTRDEALTLLKIDFSDSLLNDILSHLGLSLKDIL
ncbi:MAG: 7-cyano-7-deazaguanine synthase [Candidatus Wallbacteria bacterium]|nr:7-cyano-7-deazaguanine synthase [Candidatus Wallbacteria bacterium]